MKKTFQMVFFAAFVLAATSLFAQRPHSPHHKNLIEKFKDELNLTADQETKLTTLQEKFRAEIENNREVIKENENFDHQAMREKMHGIKEVHQKEVLAILTTEQKETLASKKAEFYGKRKEQFEKVDFKAMKMEAKAYRDKSIYPVMLIQRVKLEAKLATKDKAAITELRPVFKELKAKKMAFQEGFMTRKEMPSPELRREKMEEHKAMREQYKTEHEAVKDLIKKYDAEIEKLFAETKTQQEKWEKNLKGIHEKYMPEKSKGNHFRGNRGHKGGLNHPMFGGKPHFGREAGMKKVHFLLMDINN